MIVDLYSKRQKALRGEVPDVYTYDKIPQKLRQQIIYILHDTLGDHTDYNRFDEVHKCYEIIVNILRREYGVESLLDDNMYHHNNDFYKELTKFLKESSNTEEMIDTIELSGKMITSLKRQYTHRRIENQTLCEICDNAIKELNRRFKEHGIGFEFNNGEITRIDSELIHQEAVKPALKLLHTFEFFGVQDEFLNAYNHYRKGNNKEAFTDCLKAFESTMKSICDEQKWPYNKNANAKALIKVCFDNELVPLFWQNQFTQLRLLLESGIPTGRNKLSAHGQGSKTIAIPDHLVSFMLHITASTILMLIKSHESLKQS